MARCLIIAGGRRGLALAAVLHGHGHAVRMTTRDRDRSDEIEAIGAEPFVGDPDRVATISRAFDHVGVACLLLGSASGTAEQLRALHDTRLEMLMERMLDTTARGIVYEAAGSVDGRLLDGGAEVVQRMCDRSLIPYRLLTADPADHAVWTDAAAEAVEQVLLARGQLSS